MTNYLIEDEIFKACKFDLNKLISFGFIKKNDNYFYKTSILNGQFEIDVLIDSKFNVNGKIIDTSTLEEYTNFRFNSSSQFAQSVKEEYKKILNDIKKSCCEVPLISSIQGNRILKKLESDYQISPIFPFKKYPTYCVLKILEKNKWFSIFMNLDSKKFNKNEGEIYIIDTKVKEESIDNLVDNKAIFNAYHMNKKSWITILLDESFDDNTIIQFILDSKKLVE